MADPETPHPAVARRAEAARKWGSLALLLSQATVLPLSYRFALLGQGEGDEFSNAAVLVCSELLKLAISACAIISTTGGRGLCASLGRMAGEDRRGTALMAVPGVLYAAQNYLFFVGISNLSVSIYKVTKQAAILTTAVLSVAVFRRALGPWRWFALLLLGVGVALATAGGDVAVKGDTFVGICCVLAACVLSAGTNVFMEWMLKKDTHTIWERNVQLAAFGASCGVAGMVANDPMSLTPEVFFHGFRGAAIVLVTLQSLEGVFTSAVLKYADSVLKCVAKSVAVLLSVVLSRAVFAEGPLLTSTSFQAGMLVTMSGVVLYSLAGRSAGPKAPEVQPQPYQVVSPSVVGHAYGGIERRSGAGKGNGGGTDAGYLQCAPRCVWKDGGSPRGEP